MSGNSPVSIGELVEFGNAANYSPQGGGWLVGYGDNFQNPTLRRMAKNALAHTIGLKWMVHNPSDNVSTGKKKPISDGCTISILVSQTGNFELEFSMIDDFQNNDKEVYRKHTLTQTGEFVVWGGEIHHQWTVHAPSTILTVRWVPIEQWNHRE